MTFVEKCLYEYKANIAAIELMTMEARELSSAHGAKYEAHSINDVSDPVSDVTARILQLERKIGKLLKVTRPVERLRDDLSGNDLRIQQLREVLILKYIEQEGNESTLQKMAVSKRTYWRRVRELLQLARKYLGDV